MPFEEISLNDGNKIPAIAFGTGSVNKGKDIHAYIEQAIDAGFSHVDTAQYYGNESSVSTALRETGLARSEFFITTKYASGDVQEEVRNSLEKLGLKQLDLYLIHFPDPTKDTVKTWKEFEKVKEAGLSKSIGVSNFTIPDLEKLAKSGLTVPAVNQIRLHPYNYTQHKSLLEYHAQHGIITEAYGSLSPITTYPNGPVDAPLKKAASRLGITPTQVVFAWVKAKGAVIVTTSSSRQHLEEYLAVGDLSPLTQEEIQAIDEAGANGPPTRVSILDKCWFACRQWLWVVEFLFLSALGVNLMRIAGNIVFYSIDHPVN